MTEVAITYVVVLGAYTFGLVYIVRQVRREVIQSLTKTVTNMTKELDQIMPPIPRPEDSIFFEGEDYESPATIPFCKHGVK